jgi:hypothetical protein
MSVNPEDSPVKPEQQSVLTIEQVPEHLGFVETREMLALRAELIQAISVKDSEGGRTLLAKWQELAERVVEGQPGNENCQLGYNIALALMWKEADRPEVYADELFHGPIDYLVQPRYNRYPEIAPILQAEFALARQQADEREN